MFSFIEEPWSLSGFMRPAQFALRVACLPQPVDACLVGRALIPFVPTDFSFFLSKNKKRY
jgi:hypothetical protein